MRHSNDDGSADTGAVANSDNARLVELCAVQLQAALDEARQEMDALSLAIVNAAQQVSSLTSESTDNGVKAVVEPGADARSVQPNAATESVNRLFLRLQFADRLNQRLSNVQKNLANLAEHMRSNEKPIAGRQWVELLEQTRATFTMEHEREMFDTVFARPRDSANAPALKSTRSTPSGGLILFDEEFKDD